MFSANTTSQAFQIITNGVGMCCALFKTKAMIAIFAVLLVFPVIAAAQNGIVFGEIKDAETGEPLVGATVSVEGSTIGAATDIDGRYIIRSVPSGPQVMVFRYIGYETKLIELNVIANTRNELNTVMEMELFMGEEIWVTATQRGQSRALTRQRQSENIRNIISDEQIEAFGDITITGALSRVSGMGHGGTNIRGVGAGASNITMDGQRMGSTGGDRSVDLSTISADMVQELDIIKVITPDMDADALSGVINVSTRRPIGGARDMNVRVGGGFQDRYMQHAGTQQQFSLSYGDSPSSKFTYGFNVSYQRDPSGREGFTVNWAAPRSFQALNPDHYSPEQRALLPDYLFDPEQVEGNRVQDHISSLQNILELNLRDRIGTGIQMTFQPSQRTTFHVQGMFNVQYRDRQQYGMVYQPRMDNYQSPVHTGNPNWGSGPGAPNQGTMRYVPRLDQSTTYQYTVQAGARHILDRMTMDYSLGWGHGRFSEDQYRVGFQTNSRHEFIFNFEDRWNPTASIAPWSEINNPGKIDFPLSSIDNRIENRVNNDFKAAINFESPHRYGKFKFGSSASMAFMEGSGERLDRQYRSTLSVASFDLIPNANWTVFDRSHSTYNIPWMIDLYKARDFYINQAPNFITDMQQWALSVETSTYRGGEHTFATYGMSNLRINWFTLLGGVRVEHTLTSYSGREGSINENGIFLGARDINSKKQYTNFFPNLQTVFHMGDMTNIRLAYSRSIGRPNFNQLNPYIMRNYASRTIQQGNPNLKPMLSNNFDFLFEHYFMNVGQISLGLFYKSMRDFVYTDTDRIPEGPDNPDAEFAGWQLTTFQNGRKATVYGFEVAWQQKFDFLPGKLKNTGIYANYSYSQSIADLNRDVEEHVHGLAKLLELLGRDVSDDYKNVTPLAGQRPHVVNVGLEYNSKSFSTQLSYQWAAPSISSYGNLRILPPGVGPNRVPNRVQFDQYNDAANEVSMTARYWVTRNFQVWASGRNLLNHRSINYYYDREMYPFTSYLSGRQVTLGLRYRM
jgi:TonB-dependent receptor